MSEIPPTFDPAAFSNDSYVKRVDKPWGYELHWVRNDAPYMGKILHINAGARLSLQLHDEKHESWFLMQGPGQRDLG
jgi:mannose-6-phosphate isomerase